MSNTQNSVPTRLTTGKARLSYAFIWEPREDESNGGGDDKKKKYSTCVLIPKSDTTTLNALNVAMQHAFIDGQNRGFWGANAPTNFKMPVRDGDTESAEKGEAYMGHWFLNASSVKPPRIVDINRQDILEESSVYSGCYARVVIRLFPFNNSGNRGIGCGLEVIQKLGDGEPLGAAPVDLEAALGNWDDDSGDLPFPGEPGYDGPETYPSQQPAPAPAYQQPPAFQPAPAYQQPAQGYPVQQPGYPAQQPGYPVQQPGYPTQQGVPGSILPEQPPAYPQQPQGNPPMQQAGGYPQQVPGIPGVPGVPGIPGSMPDHFAAGVDAAGQKIGNVFGAGMQGQGKVA